MMDLNRNTLHVQLLYKRLEPSSQDNSAQLEKYSHNAPGFVMFFYLVQREQNEGNIKNVLKEIIAVIHSNHCHSSCSEFTMIEVF